ncbi:MAG: HAD family phosphatase [Dehalococcoidales bacterium]|nr:HAD family phosphatase [Dehalococcoidales bacterium]
MKPVDNIAVLWDMDGVIADTSTYHFQSWQIAFKPEGIDFTKAHFKHAFGMANIDIIPMVFGKKVAAAKIEAIGDYKEATFRSLIKGQITALPGVNSLLETLASAQIKLALVSSTPRENIDMILGTLGLIKYFPVIISGDDITEGKPSPQGYLMGAKRLGIKPENCLVIEDAIVGIKAAKAGGMKCLAVTTTHPIGELKEADLIVKNLTEVGLRDIISLLSVKE